MRIGNVAEENSTNIKFQFNKPTDLAVAPNGDLYVCEGYGGNQVHVFSAQGQFKKTIGKPGSGPGEFKIPHGIWVDTRKGKEPELYVADRTNARVQIFNLNGNLKRELKGDIVRNPCCFYEFKGKMFIPDLNKRVTILDERDQVVAHLGDGLEKQDDTAFRAPHALTVDSRGDLYVFEWVPDGRLRKFKHTPQ
jgi:sugar lactone lactonase YvrE